MTTDEHGIYELTAVLQDEDLPMISVLTPCYKRADFLRLMMLNLKRIDYPPEKICWEILQDGEECLFGEHLEECQKVLAPMEIRYTHEPSQRRTIGKKRDLLTKNAKHKVLINMDSDDIYIPTYFRYAVSCLKESKSGIVGSSGMLFIYPDDKLKTAGILCPAKRQCHEATFCYTKKYWRSIGGYNTGKEPGEGASMIDFAENRCQNIDISKCMICVCHPHNTVDKNRFKDQPIKIPDIVQEWIAPQVGFLVDMFATSYKSPTPSTSPPCK